MNRDPRADLLSELPAGEWSDIQVLNQPPGLMSSRNWAILAKAKWLRRGGKPAFIKFIIPAGSQAGPNTQWITGNSRLQSLYERLLKLRELGDKVPLVPLLDVKLTSRGLLIAMEEVTPLQNLIERGESYSLSPRVLQHLNPETSTSPTWLHFDICPQNIGLLSNGRCVLIDVDSFYLEENQGYNVTVPAWKPFRAPNFLENEVQARLASTRTDRALAIKKISYEVILSAAECVLGPLHPERGNLDEPLIHDWIKAADPADPAVSFWKNKLLSILREGEVPSIQSIEQGLSSALQSSQPSVRAPLVVLATNDPDQSFSQPTPSPTISQDPSPGWETDWLLLKATAHALRAGRLERAQIIEYRSALERLARQYPSRQEIWNELLLVSISYLKDPVAALNVAEEAVKKVPGDTGLASQRNIVHAWTAEMKNGNNG